MEQQPSSEQSVRLSSRALAHIFSMTVDTFEERRQYPTAYDRELFTSAFNFGIEQLDLEEDDAARMMMTSRGTIRRWTSGDSAPHRVGRASVFSEFLKETNRRIEQESAE